MEVKDRSAIQRHLAIVAVLLLLLIGPIFGPVPDFLGERFGIETAVIIMLSTFIASFSIILTVIFQFDEMKSGSLREKLGRLGWGQPSRLAAIIVAVITVFFHAHLLSAWSLISAADFPPGVKKTRAVQKERKRR